MGWASAGDIFDPVAKALIAAGVDRPTKITVLGTLIDKLRDGDWDTEDESLGLFAHDPAIVEAFHRHGCARLYSEAEPDYAQGELTYSGEGTDTWTLECDRCGELAHRAGPAGHDTLIRIWAAHDRDQHGGEGVVEDRHLIDRPAVAA